jgi:hypothetical protein
MVTGRRRNSAGDAEFAAIHDEYGRERLRAAMRRGLRGPAMSCSASLGMFFIWRLIIPEAVLYALAVITLVRALKVLRATTILDAREKASWNQRMALITAFVVDGHVPLFREPLVLRLAIDVRRADRAT